MPAFFMPVSFARFLPIPLVGYGVSLIFTASLRSLKNGSLAITSFKNDRPVFNTVSYEIFFRAYSRLPLPTTNAATLAKAKRLTHFYSVALLLEKWFACFPTSGDGLHLVFFGLG